MNASRAHYQPPASCSRFLGNILQLLNEIATKPIDGSVFSSHPAKYICRLPDGTLYFENDSDIDVDDDGFTSRSGILWPPWKPADWAPGRSHQEGTSYGGALGAPEAWSAFLHQYIVLPGSSPADSNIIWWRQTAGVKIGDGAVVIGPSGWIPCVFVDTGPGNKIGEMSLAAHAKFREPSTLFRKGLSGTGQVSLTTNSATPGPFITLVFPGTSFRSRDTSNLFAHITGRFSNLVGGVGPGTPL